MNDMNDIEKISCLQISVDEIAPRDKIKGYIPENNVESMWVAETLFDCVMVLYKFNTKDEREIWENSLSDELRKCINRAVIKQYKDWKWCNYDFNGFEERS